MLEKKKVTVVEYDHFLDGKQNILNGNLEELNSWLEAKEEAERRNTDKLEHPKPISKLFLKEEVKQDKLGPHIRVDYETMQKYDVITEPN